jgi:hypothetical protein
MSCYREQIETLIQLGSDCGLDSCRDNPSRLQLNGTDINLGPHQWTWHQSK